MLEYNGGKSAYNVQLRILALLSYSAKLKTWHQQKLSTSRKLYQDKSGQFPEGHIVLNQKHWNQYDLFDPSVPRI